MAKKKFRKIKEFEYYNKLLNNLETLKLYKMKENIDTYIELINKQEKDVVNSIYELTKLEIDVMLEKKAKHSIQFAGFPYYETFEDFDFSFQPSLNKEEILDFKNLRFMEKAENILFVGSPRSWKNSFINEYRHRKCQK